MTRVILLAVLVMMLGVPSGMGPATSTPAEKR